MHSELIARLEAATGPDRELDAAIAVASGQYVFEKRGRDRQEWFYSTTRDYDRRCLYYGGTARPLEAYTASIDAALTLVPAELANNFLLSISPMSLDMGGRNWKCQVGKYRAAAPTPALAICIAALRAKDTTHD
jgi:hypothetical protein